MKLNKTPIEDGFYMPAEFSKHEGCLMIWPSRPGSWPYHAKHARIAFKQIIEAISKSEKVYVAANLDCIDSARDMLKDIDNVEVFCMDSDDAWARDVGPTFVINQRGHRRCINWEFNAWGGAYNGLYSSWKKDNEFCNAFADYIGDDIYDATPFVLEGGSIHCDGEGTVIVTESCLLSPGRNPHLLKKEIEEKLKQYLNIQKVIWLPRGIYNDETDEHVDNVCAFIKPGEVVLAYTDNKDDPQFELSKLDYEYLSHETDAKGRSFIIHTLPIPDIPICVLEEDIKGYEFEEGEDIREVGERLAASYVNFYFSNDSIIVPAFGNENEESDRRAQNILKTICPDRKIVPIDARSILMGGGNIHCITQQIPLKNLEGESKE